MQPQPEYNSDDRQLKLPLIKESDAIRAILNIGDNRDVVSMNEVFWVANLPRSYLNSLSKPVYETLIKMNLDSFIPLDNKDKFFG